MVKIDHTVYCPNCNSSFDIKEHLEVYKHYFFVEIEKIINKIKGGKQ